MKSLQQKNYKTKLAVMNFQASEKLLNSNEHATSTDTTEITRITSIVDRHLKNAENLFGANIIHGFGPDDILQMFSKVLQRFKIDISRITNICDYVLINSEILDRLKKLFVDQLELSYIEWELILEKFSISKQSHLQKAAQLQQLLQKHVKYNLFLTGSVGSGVAAASSDYDFGFNESFKDIKKEKNHLNSQLKKDSYKVFECHYRKGKAKLIHLKLKDRGVVYSIDIVSKCTSKFLAAKLSKLSHDHQIWIVTCKLICKRLCLIDTQMNRLSSCSLAIAVLCYVKLHPDSNFSSFLKWFSDFDFKSSKITDNGIERKDIESYNICIVENGDNNTARCTSYDSMIFTQKIFLLLSKWDDIGSYIFSLFHLPLDKFPKLPKSKKDDLPFDIPAEACASITDLELYKSHLYYFLKYLIHTLSFGDAIIFQDYSHNENLRQIRAKLASFLTSTDDNISISSLNNLGKVLEELDAIIGSAKIIDRCQPTPDTDYEKFLKSDVKATINPQEFDETRTSHKRMIQKDKGMIFDNSHSNFPIITPSTRKCQKCSSNEHITDDCPFEDVQCLKCLKGGHVSYDCRFQQCANCCLYGHGKTKCPTIRLGAACMRCGERNHRKFDCPNPFDIFCYLCGGEHGMLACPSYDKESGLCFKHGGQHRYLDCPDQL